MNDHSTWLHLLGGYNNAQEWAKHYLEREWKLPVGFTETHFTITHVAISAIIAVLLIAGAVAYRKRISGSGSERLVPEAKFGTRNFFELILEVLLSLGEGVMGRKNAEKFLPLTGGLVFFILFNNLIGLVPGFLPATDTLKTNAAMAVLVFLISHVVGFKEHGAKYLKHFLGPVWYLAWLMLPIELVSHIVRPVSLSVRLMGNMVGDHKVLGTFFLLVPILVPLPFYVLGLLVCIVQTVVFTLLSMVYIAEAAEHEEH